VLLESVAEIYGGSTLAVILTGMGSDGLHGCDWSGNTEGRIIAQMKQQHCLGNAGAVVRAGLAIWWYRFTRLLKGSSNGNEVTTILNRERRSCPARGGYVQQANEFSYLCELVKNTTAIALDVQREYLMEARLSSIAQQEGFNSVQS